MAQFYTFAKISPNLPHVLSTCPNSPYLVLCVIYCVIYVSQLSIPCFTCYILCYLHVPTLHTLCAVEQIGLVKHVSVVKEHVAVPSRVITVHQCVIIDMLWLHHLQPLRVVPPELLRLNLLRPDLVKFLQNSKCNILSQFVVLLTCGMIKYSNLYYSFFCHDFKICSQISIKFGMQPQRWCSSGLKLSTSPDV